MNHRIHCLGLIVGVSVLGAGVVGCESTSDSSRSQTYDQSKQMDASVRRVDVTPGTAGGMIEDTTEVEAKILGVNMETRTLRLVDNAGNRADFPVGPEVKNLGELTAGDKVTATLKERLTVFVRDSKDGTSAAYAEALATAPKGAKPGAFVAEAYECVATVSNIDRTNRTATLKFVDGSFKTFNVREDVDLDRYKVGDNVVIRVSKILAVVTSRQ